MLMFLCSAQISCFAPAKNTTKGQKPALSSVFPETAHNLSESKHCFNSGSGVFHVLLTVIHLCQNPVALYFTVIVDVK